MASTTPHSSNFSSTEDCTATIPIEKAFHYRGIFPTRCNLTHQEWARRITQAQNCTKTDPTGKTSVKTDAEKFSTVFLHLGLVHSIPSPYWTPLPHTACFPCCSLSWAGIFPGDTEQESKFGGNLSSSSLSRAPFSKSLSSDHITELSLKLSPWLWHECISLSTLQTLILIKLVETQHLCDPAASIEFFQVGQQPRS